MVNIIFLFLNFIFIFLSATQSAASKFNHVNCTSNISFTPNRAFQTNLKTLLSFLSSKASDGFRFYNATPGCGGENTLYGLLMCCGDVQYSLCRECVNFATQMIKFSCPLAKEVVIWYDECLLRYSYRLIFSSMEEWPRWQLKNTLMNTQLLYSHRFYDTLQFILNDLIDGAAQALVRSDSKFVVQHRDVSGNMTLYGLAQCTLDLGAGDCKLCVRHAIAEITTSCCGGTIGERVMFPSCIVRYEVYQFYQQSSNEKADNRSRTAIITVVPIVISFVLFSLGCYMLWRKTRKNGKSVFRENFGEESSELEYLQFNLGTIEAATNNFAHTNIIGKGGFGEVYKGILPNGHEVAVKRLSKDSGQGLSEFKNEVLLIAKLQHRNLVTLLGFCLEKQEKILIYEYVANKSIDSFLFDSEKRRLLNWFERFQIIKGIAKGLLYLHEHSRLKIIHRDLKLSNILLDDNMNPKISYFGVARMIDVDEDTRNTNKIVGTFGYMAPEYVRCGQFSEKLDVYSFGVIILEIISGKRTSNSQESHLLSHAWKQWNEETPLEILDPCLIGSHSETEVKKCAQIGLLCVQENPDDRPTMTQIVSYLSNLSVELPIPRDPAYLTHAREIQNCRPQSSNEMSNSELLAVN